LKIIKEVIIDEYEKGIKNKKEDINFNTFELERPITLNNFKKEKNIIEKYKVKNNNKICNNKKLK
jgi:hypothetical protein